MESQLTAGGVGYAEADALDLGDGPVILMHGCNDVGAWGGGFTAPLARKFPWVEKAYRDWAAGRVGLPLALGRVQWVEVADRQWVANAVTQHDVGAGRSGVPPVRYDAIATALEEVCDQARKVGAVVRMPRIGCGLAGGTWEKVGPLVEAAAAKHGVRVVVCDLPAKRGA